MPKQLKDPILELAYIIQVLAKSTGQHGIMFMQATRWKSCCLRFDCTACVFQYVGLKTGQTKLYFKIEFYLQYNLKYYNNLHTIAM